MFFQTKSDVSERLSEPIEVLLSALGFVVLSLFCGLGHAGGQVQTQIISGGPTCDSCSIERHLLATIQDSTYEDGAIGQGAIIHVNSDGSFLVIAGPSPALGELYFAGRDGAIARRLGRTGEGPGEYKIPMHVMEVDSLFLIADLGLNRITYLRKASLEFDHTVPIPARVAGATPVAFPDGSYVMWGPGYSRATAGHGLHHVSADGRVLRSFGPPVGRGTPVLARSGNTAVWIGFKDYRIEKWSIEGDLLAVFIREADWVKPSDDWTKPGDRITSLSGLREDEDGLMWVHTNVRKKAVMGLDPEAATAESIIEVLDLSALTVFAQLRMSGRKEVAVDGSGFYLRGIRDSPIGLRLWDIWTFRLLRPPLFPRTRRDHDWD